MGVTKMINSILEMIKNVPEGHELSGYLYLLDGASSSIIWYDNITDCREVVEDEITWLIFNYENPDYGKSILLVQKANVSKIDLSYVTKTSY
jgi:hypothetical protein